VTATRYPFDGEMLTVAEIHKRIPGLSVETLRRRVRMGQSSTAQVLTWYPPKHKPTRAQNFVINERRRAHYMGIRA